MSKHHHISAIDTSFLLLDSATSHQAIGLYCPLGSVPDLDILRQQVSSVVSEHPILSSYVYRRKKSSLKIERNKVASFDINNHITVVNVEDFDLLEAAQSHFSLGLPFTQPLWSLTIFVPPDKPANANQAGPANFSNASIADNNLKQAAILYMLHHSVADGLGGMNLFHSFCDATPQAKSPTGNQKRSSDKKKLLSLRSSLKQLLRESHMPELQAGLLTGTNSAVRQISVSHFPLEPLVHAKSMLEISLNDVFLGIATGGIHEVYVALKHRPPAVRALMPVNLRPLKEPLILGNHLSAVAVSLPTQRQKIAERLEAVRDETVRVKYNGAIGAYALFGKLTSYLPAATRLRTLQTAAKKIHFICTNVPGPRTPNTIGGAVILGEYGIPAILPGQGIAIAFLTYAGRLHMSVISDPNIFPRGEKLAQALEKSARKLCAEAGISSEEVTPASQFRMT